MTSERWYTVAEYEIVGLDPDADLEPLGKHATEIHYDEETGLLGLSTRLAATNHPDAYTEAHEWLNRINRHLATAGHPDAPIRHAIQPETDRSHTYAPGTTEAAAAIGLDIDQE